MKFVGRLIVAFIAIAVVSFFAAPGVAFFALRSAAETNDEIGRASCRERV